MDRWVEVTMAEKSNFQPETSLQSIPGDHRDNAPDPWQNHRGHGGGSLRTPFGQSGSLRGLKLIPAKWRYPVPSMLRDGYPLSPKGDFPLKRTFGKACGAGRESLDCKEAVNLL